jgi:hypothetical protein
MFRTCVLVLALGLGACASVEVEPRPGDSFALSSDLDVIDSQAMIHNQFLDTSHDLCPNGFALDAERKEPSDLEWRISCLQPVAALPQSNLYAAR